MANQVTLISTKVTEEAKKIDSKAIIPLPPPSEAEGTKDQSKKEEKMAEQPKKDLEDKTIQKKESEMSDGKSIEGPYCSKCTVASIQVPYSSVLEDVIGR